MDRGCWSRSASRIEAFWDGEDGDGTGTGAVGEGQLEVVVVSGI
jgi:hypothetical protein